MSKTNSLTSHHPERWSHRADKMSGYMSGDDYYIGKKKSFYKKLASKKRRQLLNNIKNDKI